MISLGQSKSSLEGFVAKISRLFGQSDLEEASVDMICEYCRDIKDKSISVRDGPELMQIHSSI